MNYGVCSHCDVNCGYNDVMNFQCCVCDLILFGFVYLMMMMKLPMDLFHCFSVVEVNWKENGCRKKRRKRMKRSNVKKKMKMKKKKMRMMMRMNMRKRMMSMIDTLNVLKSTQLFLLSFVVEAPSLSVSLLLSVHSSSWFYYWWCCSL